MLSCKRPRPKTQLPSSPRSRLLMTRLFCMPAVATVLRLGVVKDTVSVSTLGLAVPNYVSVLAAKMTKLNSRKISLSSTMRRF